MWEDLEALVRLFGETDALRVAETAQRSVGEIGTWLDANGVDAWFTRGGHLTIATSPAQDDVWASLVATANALEVGERFVELAPEAVQERCRSPVFRGGLLQPDNATLQPARLVLGLRAALLARGVRIFESTPVLRFHAGSPVRVQTPGGVVTAEHGVLGIGAGRRPITYQPAAKDASELRHDARRGGARA